MVFSERVKQFRETQGFTQAEFASVLGVTKASVARWETGASKPSKLAAASLENAGFGEIPEDDTNKDSLSRIDHLTPDKLMEGVASEISLAGQHLPIIPSPYVFNGPENQLDFFRELVDLQSRADSVSFDDSYLKRLSTIKEVQGVRTSQFELERPKPNAKSWSSNYGTHGWHRYVGRFPPHLVRSLLNHFDLKNDATVLDPFVGSGTTLVEARLLGYKAIGVEICPLSALISRAKSKFPLDPSRLEKRVKEFDDFFDHTFQRFLSKHPNFAIEDILDWPQNPIPRFANDEKWFSKEALLGTSITVQFIENLKGYEQDFFACQLSSLMRSIGNVEVNVVRAEYSKKPRQNVNVKELVIRRCFKSIRAIKDCVMTHRSSIGPANSIKIHESGIQHVAIGESTIDAIITSPPYGVEAISYLRTHLLSYRSLDPILKHDPYSNSDDIIGSEYLSKENNVHHLAADYSNSYLKFFDNFDEASTPKKLRSRVQMMMKFFDEMANCAEAMSSWLKPGGMVAFVIGNKRLGDHIIPTHEIMLDVFEAHGIRERHLIKHKLKTNNSNSQVPWQSRIIQDEYIMILQRD